MYSVAILTRAFRDNLMAPAAVVTARFPWAIFFPSVAPAGPRARRSLFIPCPSLLPPPLALHRVCRSVPSLFPTLLFYKHYQEYHLRFFPTRTVAILSLPLSLTFPAPFLIFSLLASPSHHTRRSFTLGSPPPPPPTGQLQRNPLQGSEARTTDGSTIRAESGLPL